MAFTANTEKEKSELLREIGVHRFEDLISNIPQNALFTPAKNGILRDGLSEMEVQETLEKLAGKNKTVQQSPSFLGAGAYNHFVPAAVGAIISRGEFLTAYTPYQPEASQGTLQATFEFQTMVAEIYGMDVANASLYDGASALAEGILLALRETGRNKILISSAVHPEYRQVVRTYCKNFTIIELPCENGVTSFADLEKHLDADTACVAIQNPNFFGSLEEGQKWADAAHAKGALLITSSNPIAHGLLTAPGAYGADIATGEGQPLGVSLNFGGPYLGLIACKEKFVRKMPGRICGITKDLEGRRGFVLTLQTREQHIRREKATSNICTNEALMALAATVHMSLLGPEGLKEVATLCLQKAHYAAESIGKIKGFSLAFTSPYFNEFVIRSKIAPAKVNTQLRKKGITGGLELGRFYPEWADAMLFCVTEMNSKVQIDALVKALEEVSLAG